MLHAPSTWPTPAEASAKEKATSQTTLEIELNSQKTSGSEEVATTTQQRDDIEPNQTKDHPPVISKKTTTNHDEWLLKGKN